VTADWRVLTAVFFGGIVGALLRSGLVEILGASGGSWPWATFTANVLGAFLLGFFLTRIVRTLNVSPFAHPFVGAGFCGALTTFSALQIELLWMLEAGHLMLALTYSSISIAAGLLAVGLGSSLVRQGKAVR
jgi:CrcB protein